VPAVGWVYQRTAGPGVLLSANLRWLAGYRHDKRGLPESVTSALPGDPAFGAGTGGAVARKPWREAGTRSADWLNAGNQAHSFLATLGSGDAF